MRTSTLFLLIGLLPLLLGVGPAAAAEITVVTAWAQNYVFNEGVWELQKRVENKSGGTLKLKYKGGPEVVPPFEATAALSRGVFDMLNTSGAYYTSNCIFDPGSSKGGGSYDSTGTASVIDQTGPHRFSSLINPGTAGPVTTRAAPARRSRRRSWRGSWRR